MSTTQSLSTRLTTLSDSSKQTLHLITRLSKLSQDDIRHELTSEIHDLLTQQDDALELLRTEVDDLDPGVPARRRDTEKERERARLQAQVTRLGEDLRHARGAFRKAQLEAKRNAERARQAEREALLREIQEGSGGAAAEGSASQATVNRGKRSARELTQDELLVDAASDVTQALRRTHALMQSELNRSRFAQDTLQESTKELEGLSERYTDLDSLLKSSRTLLATLYKSQKSDTWYLQTSVSILLGTLAWLVFRRWFYGPLWWFVWLPLKLSYRILIVLLSAVGATGGAQSLSAQSSSLAASPPTLSATLSSSPSLIIKPSAAGGIPRHSMDPNANQRPNIPAGRGGMGAGQQPQPSQSQQSESLTESIAKMGEEAQKQADTGKAEEGKAEEKKEDLPLGGDGQPLRARRADEPRNPKKRMFEEPPAEQAGTGQERPRDEL